MHRVAGSRDPVALPAGGAGRAGFNCYGVDSISPRGLGLASQRVRCRGVDRAIVADAHAIETFGFRCRYDAVPHVLGNFLQRAVQGVAETAATSRPETVYVAFTDFFIRLGRKPGEGAVEIFQTGNRGSIAKACFDIGFPHDDRLRPCSRVATINAMSIGLFGPGCVGQLQGQLIDAIGRDGDLGRCAAAEFTGAGGIYKAPPIKIKDRQFPFRALDIAETAGIRRHRAGVMKPVGKGPAGRAGPAVVRQQGTGAPSVGQHGEDVVAVAG